MILHYFNYFNILRFHIALDAVVLVVIPTFIAALFNIVLLEYCTIRCWAVLMLYYLMLLWLNLLLFDIIFFNVVIFTFPIFNAVLC